MRLRVFIFLLFSAFSLVAQQSIRVKDLEKQRKAALEEIEITNKLLSENKKTTSNALNRLSLLTQQIDSRKKIITLLNEEVNSINKEIDFKELQIKTLERELHEKKEHYANSVKKMYSHRNNQDNLLFVLSGKDISQSFRRILYLKEYTNWRKIQADEIVEKQGIINVEKAILEKSKIEKEALLSDRKTEEKQLEKEETSKKAEVESLRKDQKKLQKELAEKRKQAETLNKQIERIIAEEVAKANKESKAKGGETRVAETKGGYAMTKEEQALSSNFANNRGKLPFPLKGSYKIVARFGVHQHKELSNISTNNNGIDIETTPGNEARAVFNGTVSRVFTVPGYQNSVIVRHGNYLTLYSYLESVQVKQGDKVTTGQSIGKIYTDREKGNSTILHFELWKEQTKLNPLSWLNR